MVSPMDAMMPNRLTRLLQRLNPRSSIPSMAEQIRMDQERKNREALREMIRRECDDIDELADQLRQRWGSP